MYQSLRSVKELDRRNHSRRELSLACAPTFNNFRRSVPICAFSGWSFVLPPTVELICTLSSPLLAAAPHWATSFLFAGSGAPSLARVSQG